MELEQVTAPAEALAEEEVTTTETPATETEAEPKADEQSDESEAEAEFEEVEVDGKRYSVPKELAPQIMKNADYTQKTQALAETRRAWETQIAQEREALAREREIEGALIEDAAQLRFVEARLNELQQVNAYQLNPADQQRYLLEMTQLRQFRDDIGGRMNQKRSQLEAESTSRVSKVLSEAVEELSKPDERLGWPGKYDKQTASKLATFGREIGLDNGFLSTIRSPALVKALHLAMVGHETLKKQKAATVQPKPVAQPVPQVGGSKAKGVVNPDKLPIDQWMKWDTERQRKAGRIR